MNQVMIVSTLAVLLSFTSFTQPLSGNYTIGGGGADFDSIGHAVTSLVANGISGPVVLSIRPGIYTEQVVIPEIAGATALNTITFQSESGNRDEVTWQFAPTFTQNYVVLLDGADHVRFLNMTFDSGLPPASYGVIIRFLNQVDDVLINGNVFRAISSLAAGPKSPIYLTDTDPVTISHLSITDNEFYEYSTAIHLNDSGRDSWAVVITGNLIDDPGAYEGIHVDGFDSLAVENNVVNARSTGIFSSDCPNRIIRSNQVTVDFTGISVTGGGRGIGPWAGLVANNMVIAGTSNSASGIILNGNISGLKVFHNTVYCTEPVFAGGAALTLFQPNALQGAYRIYNNIFTHDGAGLALRALSTGTNFEMDYNDFYSNGANMAYWVGTLCPDLSTLQGLSGQDAHSVNIEVELEDPLEGDLHLSGCSVGDAGLKGIGLPEVPFDIDGQVRDVIDPYMGADETFDSPPNLFTARRDYAIAVAGHRFDSGDLNGDGSVDIAVAVAPQLGGPGGITVFVNDGSGEFIDPNELTIAFSDDDIWTVEIADLDGQNGPDLIATTDDTIWISYAAGGGTFFEAGPLPGCPACVNDDIDVADLDGDGDLDLMLRYEGDIAFGDPGVLIDYLNLGDHDFYPTSNFWNGEVVMHPSQTRFADFDNDGLLDIVVSDVVNGEFAVQFNLGLDASDEWLGYNDGTTYSVSNKDLFAADFDGDGSPDVMTQEFFDILSVDSLTLLRNIGGGLLGFPELLDTDNYREPVRFVPLDYDGDGALDIVTANVTGDISLLLNDGTGHFERVVACDTTAHIGNITWHKDILTDDFNGDGKPDVALLWSNSGSDTVSVYLNAGWSPTAVRPLEEWDALPTNAALHQNFPNPFNPTTTIGYQLPAPSHVTLRIYNILGQEVATLVDEIQEAGYRRQEWKASNVASGVYLYRIEAQSLNTGQIFTGSKKLILVK